MRLLEQTALALQKGDRAIPIILYRFNFDLPTTHRERLFPEKALEMCVEMIAR